MKWREIKFTRTTCQTLPRDHNKNNNLRTSQSGLFRGCSLEAAPFISHCQPDAQPPLNKTQELASRYSDFDADVTVVGSKTCVDRKTSVRFPTTYDCTQYSSALNYLKITISLADMDFLHSLPPEYTGAIVAGAMLFGVLVSQYRRTNESSHEKSQKTGELLSNPASPSYHGTTIESDGEQNSQPPSSLQSQSPNPDFPNASVQMTSNDFKDSQEVWNHIHIDSHYVCSRLHVDPKQSLCVSSALIRFTLALFRDIYLDIVH